MAGAIILASLFIAFALSEGLERIAQGLFGIRKSLDAIEERQRRKEL